jgi:phosphopantothenoylcysteine decarboxylase/phosphopantothenate--cysteine ligase
MARILITSGPTRQYLDPVRYLTNGSSGRMGAAISDAALAAGHHVVVVSGPVNLTYDPRVRLIPVTTTEEMLAAAAAAFADCDGLIGVAAPCDYRPLQVAAQKIAKTGQPLLLELHETPDIVATLAASKGHRWVVGFALETSDHHFRALTKLQRKCCDLIVLNAPAAMDAASNSVELLAPGGEVLLRSQGPKSAVACELFAAIEQRLINSSAAVSRRRGNG